MMKKRTRNPRTFFCDKISSEITDSRLTVTHSHWLEKRLSFSIVWDNVKAIHSVQIEPFDMSLVFVDDEDKEYQMTETMPGWGTLLDFVNIRFSTFDWDAFETAKSCVNESFLCWARAARA